MNWTDIQKVNSEIKTTQIPAKKKENGMWVSVTNDYVEVKERVIAFRKLFPLGKILTNLQFTDKHVLCTAEVYSDNEKLLSTGHARELLTKDFAVENVETSALGRALGFLALGVSASLASAEEIQQIDSPSGIFDEPYINKDMVEKFKSLYSVQERVQIMNMQKVTREEDIRPEALKRYVLDREQTD